MSATAKLISTILDYPDDGSSMLNRFKKLAAEAATETVETPTAPNFDREIDEARKLWDLQKRL